MGRDKSESWNELGKTVVCIPEERYFFSAQELNLGPGVLATRPPEARGKVPLSLIPIEMRMLQVGKNCKNRCNIYY